MKYFYSKPIIYKTQIKVESDLCCCSAHKRGDKVVKDNTEVHIKHQKGFDEYEGRIMLTEFDNTFSSL